MTIDQLQNAIHEQIMKLELDMVYARSRINKLQSVNADEEIIDEAQCSLSQLEFDHERYNDAWNVINTVELWNR